AELILENTGSLVPYETANTDGVYNADEDGDVDLSTFDWQDPNNNTRGYNLIDSNIDGVAAQPRFIIEFTKTVVSEEDRLNIDNIGGSTGSGRTQMFRATAYGTGGTASAHAMIQITYGKRF
ncbi:MAG: pilus assembly protein, partial [Pseudomonadales bacterium]|nr:pilus assembly protein [Pseudomonadales bacterium]